MEGDLQRIVGVHLRGHRAERGLTQAGLAEELGFNRTYVGGLERGERNLTLCSLERLADLVGVDPLDLLKRPAQDRS